ncbi:hydroxymethylbilane synthase [Oligella urethralis]|uniref:Porphobilinogen deaminase n=1 Tax=Oligella urethralis TaxID=90245 RepID=A0A2X1UN67_9BURK|nr:Porphobilinogen deaminase [Oligella urethralis]
MHFIEITLKLPEKIVIATRASRLALWQAEFVQHALQTQYPSLVVELLKLTTKGDQIIDRSLSKIGGKGLFVKELESALLDGRADLAVHSLKDVPMALYEEFALSTILKRADPRDAFVSNRYETLDDLPEGAVLGTSSLRREAQIRALYPHLVVQPLRGNLDTRLGKLDAGDYDAIILAASGLERLGLAERIRSYLTVDQSLPAAGQGALGIEILASRDDLRELLAFLACAESTATATAERAISQALGGSCQVPIAAHAVVEDNQLYLRAMVALPDGTASLTTEIRGDLADAQQLGDRAAEDLLAKGGRRLLDEALKQSAARSF